MKLLDRLDALRVPWRLGGGQVRLKKGVEIPAWLARAVAQESVAEDELHSGLHINVCDACLGVVRPNLRLDLPESQLHFWCAPPGYYADGSREKMLTRVSQLGTLYAGLFEAAERGELKRMDADGSLHDAGRVVARVRRHLAVVCSGPPAAWAELGRLEDELREFAAWEPWSGK